MGKLLRRVLREEAWFGVGMHRVRNGSAPSLLGVVPWSCSYRVSGVLLTGDAARKRIPGAGLFAAAAILQRRDVGDRTQRGRRIRTCRLRRAMEGMTIGGFHTAGKASDWGVAVRRKPAANVEGTARCDPGACAGMLECNGLIM